MRKYIFILAFVILIIIRAVQYLDNKAVDKATVNQSSAPNIAVTISTETYSYQGKAYSLSELCDTIKRDFPSAYQLEITYQYKGQELPGKLSALSLALLKAKYQVSIKTQ